MRKSRKLIDWKIVTSQLKNENRTSCSSVCVKFWMSGSSWPVLIFSTCKLKKIRFGIKLLLNVLHKINTTVNFHEIIAHCRMKDRYRKMYPKHLAEFRVVIEQLVPPVEVDQSIRIEVDCAEPVTHLGWVRLHTEFLEKSRIRIIEQGEQNVRNKFKLMVINANILWIFEWF